MLTDEELYSGMKVRIKTDTFLSNTHRRYAGQIVTVENPVIPSIKEFPEEEKWIPPSKLEKVGITIPDEYFEID